MEQYITKEYVTQQYYENYTGEDHDVWKLLYEQQKELNFAEISKVYLDGLRMLAISKTNIPLIADVSDILMKVSGWSLIPVTGLLDPKEFFLMLINKEYPVTVPIRKRHELSFSEQPDIFHDIVGHLPLLTNELFVKYLTKFSIIAIKYVKNERAIEFLGRLYWYTYEMGLIREDGQNKPYGGAVLTSSEEIKNIKRNQSEIHKFDIDKIFNTAYNPFDLQNEYFYINSFDELFDSLELIEEKLISQLYVTEHDNVLRNYSINRNLGPSFNNVIGFLNDTQFKYPNAISFVAGQPDENFFDVEQHISKFDTYVKYRAETSNQSRLKTVNKIGQYNKTNGIINDILVKYLRHDENIDVHDRDILVTVGAQEAFATIVSTVCDREDDLILMEDPTYMGLSSYAKVFDYKMQGVRIDEDGIDLAELRTKILDAHKAKKRVKLVYVIPDYQNPTGSCMPIGSRLKLLEMAEKYNFLIVEDAVYNSFTYLQKKNPTLKSLDQNNRVIFVGSFSKSLFPGLRIGLIVANQIIENELGELVPLIDEMGKLKAQLTINTSTVSQGILAGILIDQNFSLQKYNEPKYKSYKQKNEAILAALDQDIRKSQESWSQGITWTIPRGGFFIKLSVPFEVDRNSVVEAAEKFGIMFSPMRFFHLDEGGECEMRLTFSNLSVDQISEGVKKLAKYCQYKVAEIAKG
ncbi:MAG: (S)-3,5-dihydroxyphenylglycine transaminase [Crocinitomix sp.]|jgi:(S)-3,5-dihydroxyphenylglycine transaminase